MFLYFMAFTAVTSVYHVFGNPMIPEICLSFFVVVAEWEAEQGLSCDRKASRAIAQTIRPF